MASINAYSLAGDYNSLDLYEVFTDIKAFAAAGHSTGFSKKQITFYDFDAYPWSENLLAIYGKFKGINTVSDLFKSKTKITGFQFGSNYAEGREKWGFTSLFGANYRASKFFADTPSKVAARALAGDDVITGSNSSDDLYGYGGDDLIDGAEGGYDDYWGGAGADTFAIRRTGESVSIYDFNPAEDRIQNVQNLTGLRTTNYTAGETTLWAGNDIVAFIKSGSFTLNQLNIF